MSTPPVTPIVVNNSVPPTPQTQQLLASSIPQEIHAALMDQANSLAQKHVQVSYLLLGILGLTLVLGGIGAYFAAKLYDNALARAAKSEELYKADKVVSDKAVSDLKTQLAASETARALSEQKVADLQKQRVTVAATASKKKAEVLKPGKTASQAYTDLAGQYTLQTPLTIVQSPDKTEQELAFRVSDVQQFTVAQINLDAALQTISLEDEQLKVKDDEIAGLKTDLAASGDALTKLQITEKQENDTLKKYKTLAKVSKFRRILNGAIKPAIFAAGFVAGFEFGKHL